MPDRALPGTWPSDRADRTEISVKMASQLLLKLRQIYTVQQCQNLRISRDHWASPDKYESQFMPDRALPRKWPSDRADITEISVKMASQLLIKLRQIYTVEQ